MPPLGKLPGITIADTPTPKYPAILAGNDDSNIQSEPFFINNACHDLSEAGAALLRDSGFAAQSLKPPSFIGLMCFRSTA